MNQSQSTMILPLHVFDAINLRDQSWRSTVRASDAKRPDEAALPLFGPRNIGHASLTNIQTAYELVGGAAAARIQNWYAVTDMTTRGPAFDQWAKWTTLTIRVRGLAYATRSIHDLLQRASGQLLKVEPLSDDDGASNEMIEHRHLAELGEKFYWVHEKIAKDRGLMEWAGLGKTDHEAWMHVAAEAKKELCAAPALTVRSGDEFYVEIASTRSTTDRLLTSMERDDLPAAVWLHLEGLTVFQASESA
jgi:hypothetical protein